MLSFYAGPNGKSFAIEWIFSTRFGEGNSMESDIGMGWKSPISVGSYVVISYGLPSSKDYAACLKQDGKNYNSTLWCKVQDETKNENNGITYELIMSMAGTTPLITFTQPIDKLDADKLPNAIIDDSNPDVPSIKLQLPRSQVLSLNLPILRLDVDEPPYVIYDEGSRDSNDNIVPGEHGGTINRPVLAMGIPLSQFINKSVMKALKAGEAPRVTCEIGTRNSDGDLVPGEHGGTINNPVLVFGIPASLVLLQGTVETIDANESPRFEIDSTDPDKPTLKFWLPQSQVMLQPSSTAVGPSLDPSVTIDNSNINKPKLKFELPRAAGFYYGSLLGKRNEGTYTETNEAFTGYKIGDYYINAETGFIYEVTAVDGITCTFKYIACILQPLPEVSTVSISPYTEDGELNIPKVERAFTNDELTEWKLEFLLPKIPKPTTTSNFISSLEKGSVDVSITDADTINFNFNIPAGSRVFAGVEIDSDDNATVIDGALQGDLYVNSSTGQIYILLANKIWKVQLGTLKGPVGNNLNIVRSYEVIGEDSFDAGRDHILNNYKDSEGNSLPLSPDKIFAVTFTEEGVSYWYFYDENNQWGRVLLTGGVANIIENSWLNSSAENPINNKTYSIDYINKLIGGTAESDKDKTAFSKELIYKLLSWGTWEDAKKEGGAL